jgi:hypothetical protein
LILATQREERLEKGKEGEISDVYSCGGGLIVMMDMEGPLNKFSNFAFI